MVASLTLTVVCFCWAVKKRGETDPSQSAVYILMKLRLTKPLFLVFARLRGGAYGQSGLIGLFSVWQRFLVYIICISVMKILHTSFYLPFLSPFLSLLLFFFLFLFFCLSWRL